jgi:general secretion pathway protein E
MSEETLPVISHLSPDQVLQARSNATHSGRSTIEELEAIAGLPANEFTDIAAADLGLRRLTTAELGKLTPDFSVLGFSDCALLHCLLATDENGHKSVVCTDPFNLDFRARCSQQWREREMVLMHRSEFAEWMTRLESEMTALSSHPRADSDTVHVIGAAEELSLARIGADTSVVVQFVNSTLYDALKAGASDIHLESDAGGLNVKFRLDGVLNMMGHMDGVAAAEQILSRIKVMAELDISERRIPQDGRLQVVRAGRAIDVRVSVMPSIHGEDAVLRILDRDSLAQELSGLTLRGLGFSEASAAQIRRLASMPYGMLLVTGPTGSGKTTTLYAALSETHNSRDKTITIEDPVEYQLPGVLQIPVNERKGLTFAVGLRSILRHDPDRILVGEIRDKETAQIAVQSALTGHLVFTTVHANGVLDVFSRFLQFELDPYALSSALNGILAQRLVRKLCSACARGASAEERVVATEDGIGANHSLEHLRAPVGCADCRGTGYKGRFAIGEVLKLTPALRALIAAKRPVTEIEAVAHQAGLVTLRRQAVQAAESGMTSVEEVNRVTAE